VIWPELLGETNATVKLVAVEEDGDLRICAIAVKFDKSSAEPVESLIVNVVEKVAPWSINIFDIDAIHTVSFYLFIRKVRWSYATK
tara:strand:+ start:1396 stop:1653 length:258 start_codon:yes stop_codon:yes gene_type:complete